MSPQVPPTSVDSETESNSDQVLPDSDVPTSQSPFSSPRTHTMSPQQRTEILRKCHEKVIELENNINVNTHKYLEPIIAETDRVAQDGTIEEKLKYSEEMVLDSKIVCTTSIIIKKCSSNLLRGFSKYDSTEFAEKIVAYIRRMPDTIGEETIDWTLFGRQILRHFNKTAKFNMFLGTLRPIAKKEVVRKKTVRQAQAPTKRPENVMTVDKVEDSVEETVNGIKRIIKRHYKHHEQPLDFFALVLHPTSYGKTIENMLHTSFLIRDGFVKFILDEEGIPYVQECPGEKDKQANEEKSKTNRNIRNIQNVLSLNMHQWKALVEAYGITKPMIDLDSIKKSKNTK